MSERHGRRPIWCCVRALTRFLLIATLFIATGVMSAGRDAAAVSFSYDGCRNDRGVTGLAAADSCAVEGTADSAGIGRGGYGYDDRSNLLDASAGVAAYRAAPRTSPWTLGPSPRGFAIEEALGANLPRSFPTIDRFAGGTATSIKSIDLTAASYQVTSRLSSRLAGYVDSAARFNGASFGGRTITSSSITGRELVIAVQSGATNASQQGVLNQIVQYGASNGVVVRVVPVP